MDPTKEHWSVWLIKTLLLPWIFWNRVLKGEPQEGAHRQPLALVVHLLGLDYRPAADLDQWQHGASNICSYRLEDLNRPLVTRLTPCQPW
jgi:hypothetical protein